MSQPSKTAVAPDRARANLEAEDLTREQRVILSRITNRFRESAVCQVLTGAPESGKTTIAQISARLLDQNVETATISKEGDQSPANKRMMHEAYGSYGFLLSAVLKQLGFYARGEETDLVEQLVERLRALRDEDRRLLIVIDDAQELTPGVWKRLQCWLEYQDRGIRMIQVLLVGSPTLKRMLSEPILRGWRRWVAGSHDLRLLKWGRSSDEVRRMMKRICENYNAQRTLDEPITAPRISWLASRKIVRDAGGCPGRLHELVRRVLNASLRDGGTIITRRFLSGTDALRFPGMQAQKEAQDSSRKTRKAERTTTERGAAPPLHALDWVRYALGALLVVFVLGAGWGITGWLSLSAQKGEGIQTASLEPLPIVDEEDWIELEAKTEVWADSPAPRNDLSFGAELEEELVSLPSEATSEDVWSSLDAVPDVEGYASAMEEKVASLNLPDVPDPVTGRVQVPDALPEAEPLMLQTAEPIPVTDSVESSPLLARDSESEPARERGLFPQQPSKPETTVATADRPSLILPDTRHEREANPITNRSDPDTRIRQRKQKMLETLKRLGDKYKG